MTHTKTTAELQQAIEAAVQQEQESLAAMQRAEERYVAGEISESERREAWRAYFAAGRAAAEALRGAVR
jgi:hypothetical protein